MGQEGSSLNTRAKQLALMLIGNIPALTCLFLFFISYKPSLGKEGMKRKEIRKKKNLKEISDTQNDFTKVSTGLISLGKNIS